MRTGFTSDQSVDELCTRMVPTKRLLSCFKKLLSESEGSSAAVLVWIRGNEQLRRSRPRLQDCVWSQTGERKFIWSVCTGTIGGHALWMGFCRASKTKKPRTVLLSVHSPRLTWNVPFLFSTLHHRVVVWEKVLSKAYKIWKKTQVIVKKISVKNSFLYLVAYFVDKKTKQWFRTWRRRRRRRRGIRWLHVCANVCVSVCVSERTCVCVCVTAFYLYRRMCDMFFFLTDTEHTPTTPVPRSRCLSLGGVREGCRRCSNKNCSLFFFFWEKDKKAVAVIETLFS